jgi:chromosome segregation ATPase
MATRRQLRAERDEALTRARTAEARARDLERRLTAAGESRVLSSDRKQHQADRILRLERELKQARADAIDVPAEVAGLRRQLATALKQLDDATKGGDGGWNWAPRPAPRPDGEVTP